MGRVLVADGAPIKVACWLLAFFPAILLADAPPTTHCSASLQKACTSRRGVVVDRSIRCCVVRIEAGEAKTDGSPHTYMARPHTHAPHTHFGSMSLSGSSVPLPICRLLASFCSGGQGPCSLGDQAVRQRCSSPCEISWSLCPGHGARRSAPVPRLQHGERFHFSKSCSSTFLFGQTSCTSVRCYSRTGRFARTTGLSLSLPAWPVV